MAKNKAESLILIAAGVILSLYFFRVVPPENLDLAMAIPGALVGAGLDQWKK